MRMAPAIANAMANAMAKRWRCDSTSTGTSTGIYLPRLFAAKGQVVNRFATDAPRNPLPDERTSRDAPKPRTQPPTARAEKGQDHEMSNKAYDQDHREERANWQALIDAGHPVDCWRCKKRIHPGQPMDLGHIVDLALGGNPKRRRPEHAGCNRAAGGAVGTNPKPSRPW